MCATNASNFITMSIPAEAFFHTSEHLEVSLLLFPHGLTASPLPATMYVASNAPRKVDALTSGGEKLVWHLGEHSSA